MLIKVVPVYKAGDETEPGNYRPISLLLSLFNRLFERLMNMNKRLTLFIEKNKILSQSQYGFRKNHSTQNAILDIVNTIQSNRPVGSVGRVPDYRAVQAPAGPTLRVFK